MGAAREQTTRAISQRVRIQFTPMHHPEMHSMSLPALPVPAVAHRQFQESAMGGMLHPHASVISRWLHGREQVH